MTFFQPLAVIKVWFTPLLFLAQSSVSNGEEIFVTINRVSGNQMQVTKSSEGGGRGMRGGQGGNAQDSAGQRRGRGRFRGGSSAPPTIVTVPSTAKITTAMRERRTFEFRVMGEIAGGLRNPIFTRMKQPMQARIVTKNNRIMELNVITGDTDINQSSTASTGESIIAVRPKRPPMKKK